MSLKVEIISMYNLFKQEKFIFTRKTSDERGRVLRYVTERRMKSFRSINEFIITIFLNKRNLFRQGKQGESEGAYISM